MTRKKAKNEKADKSKEAEETQEQTSVESEISGLLDKLEKPPESKTLALYGEIDEEKASEICAALIYLSKSPLPADKEEEVDPIEFYVSTYGGSADDMFSIYDMMNVIKKDQPIITYGIGKVMSAGVLILANGTPGKRMVGRHCRVMIHSCNAGSVGDIHDLKNEMKAIQHQQDQYINALVEVSSMTKRQLQRLLDRKVNVYLTAEEAIEYGIADEIM